MCAALVIVLVPGLGLRNSSVFRVKGLLPHSYSYQHSQATNLARALHVSLCSHAQGVHPGSRRAQPHLGHTRSQTGQIGYPHVGHRHMAFTCHQ